MRLLLFVGLLCVCASDCVADEVDFAHEVLPILKQHCIKCHADGMYKAGLSFDTREALLEGGVVEPGDSAASHLIDRITTDDDEMRMPPEGSALTDGEVAVLRRWIDAGLPWEEGFSFKPTRYQAPLLPRRPDLPAPAPGVENPIDRIVFQYWQERGIAPPGKIDDAAFYRRASLDLTGLLPAPDAVDAFVADGDPHKRALLVQRLLADRVAYADHWLTFWNDLLRNDYAGTGYIDGGREQITGWLYRSLLNNMPYDQFVQELVSPTPESRGFAKGIVWRGQVNASQRPELQFAQNVGQVFLGVNLKCASCHDSFIDDWKLTDAYGLAAICSEEPLEIHRCDKPTGEMAKPYFLFSELGQVDPQLPREERLAQLASIMTLPENGRLTRTIVNRLWHRLMGRGIVHPVDAMGSAPWNRDLLDYLAVYLQDTQYDLKKVLELIATSRVYAMATTPLNETAPAEEYVFHGPAPKRMTAEQFVDAIARITGEAAEQSANDELFTKSLPASDDSPRAPRPFVRASLVKSTPLMRTLGRPTRDQVVTTRPAEMTTLEALELSNGEPLSSLIAAGATRLMSAVPGQSAVDYCTALFKTALGREPDDEELATLVEMMGDPVTTEGLADAIWCVIMLPEFQVVR